MDAFLGEIRIFCGMADNAPQGWAFCEGQVLNIAGNDALFSLIGFTYGGDGKTNFQLPSLNGRVPIGAGQGPDLSLYKMGDKGGQDVVTLTIAQLPAHTHSVNASQDPATKSTPTNAIFAAVEPPALFYDNLQQKTGSDANYSTLAIGSAGGSQPHDNYMPTMALRYIICLSGLYPYFQ
ncbi:phage tail protein [Nguyenibacter vanlangensis]|uniref:Phage tail protein n=1 Tax=Nguyenibacter vanlangensis TaxID=1216886 RepID=A0A7Y7ITQ8_9PROT|nr:tail fiber protein [Nguyenibacter vanlangensis]NVN10173.1 phage tail protein [Nguyenibacter vanlangensis]